MKMILWSGVTRTRGTALKSQSIRKVGNHWTKVFPKRTLFSCGYFVKLGLTVKPRLELIFCHLNLQRPPHPALLDSTTQSAKAGKVRSQ